jgi:hypothetical protein
MLEDESSLTDSTTKFDFVSVFMAAAGLRVPHVLCVLVFWKYAIEGVKKKNYS